MIKIIQKSYFGAPLTCDKRRRSSAVWNCLQRRQTSMTLETEIECETQSGVAKPVVVFIAWVGARRAMLLPGY